MSEVNSPKEEAMHGFPPPVAGELAGMERGKKFNYYINSWSATDGRSFSFQSLLENIRAYVIMMR